MASCPWWAQASFSLYCGCITLQPLHAISTQPTPSPLLGSDLQSLSFSTQPLPVPADKHLRLWVQGRLWAQTCLCRSPFCLLQTCCYTLLQGSEDLPPFWSISPPVTGLPGCWNISFFIAPSQGFRFHPDSFLFLFSSFFCLHSYMKISWPFRSLRSSASIQMFCENCSTCSCIFDVVVVESKLHILFLHHLDGSLWIF